MSTLEKLRKCLALVMVLFMLVFTTSCATTTMKRSTSVDPDGRRVEEKVEESNPKFLQDITSLLVMGAVIAVIFLAAGAAGYYDDGHNR